MQRRNEQLIDRVSIDQVLEAGFSSDEALQTVTSFREFIETHKDEITALQLNLQPTLWIKTASPTGKSKSWLRPCSNHPTPGRPRAYGRRMPNWKKIR